MNTSSEYTNVFWIGIENPKYLIDMAANVDNLVNYDTSIIQNQIDTINKYINDTINYTLNNYYALNVSLNDSQTGGHIVYPNITNYNLSDNYIPYFYTVF